MPFLQHLGRYFKQSSRALEQQVAREARFYGSLIRLQQNWNVKRQHSVVTGSGSENFTIDLQDNSISDGMLLSHPSSLSTFRVDEDSADILAVQRPLKSCHSLYLEFLEGHSSCKAKGFIRRKGDGLGQNLSEVKKAALTDEDVNECAKDTHWTLREIHQSIFQEQVGTVPYLHFLSQPTWNSRTYSWSGSWKVPQSILHSGRQTKPSDNLKSGTRSQFHTKVVVKDDQITVSAEGAPGTIGLFSGNAANVCSINCFGSDLEDLP